MTIMDNTYNTRLVLLVNANTDNYINTQNRTFETKRRDNLGLIISGLIIITFMLFVIYILVCSLFVGSGSITQREYRISALTKGSDGRICTSPKGYSLNVYHEMRHTHTLMEQGAEKIHET